MNTNIMQNYEFITAVLNEIPVGVAIMDSDEKLIYFNEAASITSKIKYPDLPPDKWVEKYGIYHENGQDPYYPEEMPLLQALKGNVVTNKTMVLRKPDVQDVILSVSAKPIKDDEGKILASMATFVNKNEEFKMKARLETANRLESIGRFAGGIAHDFNNMLGTVLMTANQCIKNIPLDHPCQEELKLIVEVGEKTASLTHQLLAFGRKQIMKARLINISTSVKSNLKMLGHFLGSNIDIKFIQSANDPTIMVDPVQFDQIVLNLTTNARDSMPKGGQIIIETDIVKCNPDQFAGSITTNTKNVKDIKDFVLLSISDSGSGIPKEEIEKIFDPFYSSKKSGYGLGLSTVHEIVEQSEGHIFVESEVGKGTTFKIYFPYIINSNAKEEFYEDDDLSIGGIETILLVEDEINLQKAISKCLARNGYNVMHASNAEEAIQLAKSSNVQISLLITDIIMPGMNGNELAAKLKEEKSNLKIIYTSGYSENIIMQHGIYKESINFLPKPASEKELLKKIRQALTVCDGE